MKNDNRYKIAAREAAESRFARNVAACLTESAGTVAPDVAERLRFAREKSLEIARHSREGALGIGVTASGATVAALSLRHAAMLRAKRDSAASRAAALYLLSFFMS